MPVYSQCADESRCKQLLPCVIWESPFPVHGNVETDVPLTPAPEGPQPLLSTGTRLSQEKFPLSCQPHCKTVQEKAEQALRKDLALRELILVHCITWTNMLEKHLPIPAISKTALLYSYPVPTPTSHPHPPAHLSLTGLGAHLWGKCAIGPYLLYSIHQGVLVSAGNLCCRYFSSQGQGTLVKESPNNQKIFWGL